MRHVERELDAAENGIVDFPALAQRDERLTLGLDHFAFRARAPPRIFPDPRIWRALGALPGAFVAAAKKLRVLRVEAMFAFQLADAVERCLEDGGQRTLEVLVFLVGAVGDVQSRKNDRP